MNSLATLRIAALYGPILLAFATIAARRKLFTRLEGERLFPATLLALLWTLPTLLILQRLNQHFALWTFAPSAVALRNIPLELYLGWAILWGIVPALAFCGRTAIALPTMVALDLVSMPAMRPLVLLSPHWLRGEAAAIALVLLPALAIAHLTRRSTHLPLRAGMQVATAGLLFLYLIPEIAFALRPSSPGWTPLLALTGWRRQLALELLLLLALPGVAAVVEFAERGLGNPIPYDPPRLLVTSGIFRFCRNPMQLSCTSVLAAWALLLHNPSLLLPAAIALVYSAGLAEWDEADELRHRFGAPWQHYREHVQPWQLRWRPYHAGPPAALYVATTCGPCSELRAWLEARNPLGLAIRAAESLPQDSIRRMRYSPGDGAPPVAGVRALGRALEHLNLGYALAGAVLRLPGIWRLAQLSMDAAGLGPRTPAAYRNATITVPDPAAET